MKTSRVELLNVGVDGMDAFMKDKVRRYTDAAEKLGPRQHEVAR